MSLHFLWRCANLAVYLAAAACFVFYLAAIPLKFAIVFSTNPQPALRSGASIFEGRFALRRAFRPKNAKKRSLPDSRLISPAIRAGKYLLRRLHIDYLRAQGVLSSPDAARTALICGAARSLQAACMELGNRVQISLQPDFSGRNSEIEITGMLSIRAGHIILAAQIFALSYLKERLKTWTQDIRSKISCIPRWKASVT